MLQAILLLVQSLKTQLCISAHGYIYSLETTPNKRTTKLAVDNTFGVAGFIQC